MGRFSLRHALLYFNIDEPINKVLPSPEPLYNRLPKPISHFLGHRNKEQQPLPPTIETIHAVISIFAALLSVSAITQHAPAIHRFAPPTLVPSLGAGAVLNFVTINNPAAQPRPTIFGQAISAACGVGISKLFQMNPNFSNLEWIAAPLAVAVATLVMRLTNTIHPPGGATAALAVGSSEIRKLGWWLVALITIGTCVMVGTACLLNNIGRKWPEFWWTSAELPVKKGGEDEEEDSSKDEKRTESRGHDSDEEATVGGSVNGDTMESGGKKSGEEAAKCCAHCGRH